MSFLSFDVKYLFPTKSSCLLVKWIRMLKQQHLSSDFYTAFSDLSIFTVLRIYQDDFWLKVKNIHVEIKKHYSSNALDQIEVQRLCVWLAYCRTVERDLISGPENCEPIQPTLLYVLQFTHIDYTYWLPDRSATFKLENKHSVISW